MTQPTLRRTILCEPHWTMRKLVLLGSSAMAFTACGPSSSPGDCVDEMLAGDLVITEVFADAKAPPGGSGTDDGKEWFEIYNSSNRAIELKGMKIVHARPDGTRAKSHVMREATIQPGQYFTLGNVAPDLRPPYVDYGYGADLGDMFNTGGGKLSLSCGSSEIDSAVYDNVVVGRSRQLTAAQPPDYTLNDDQMNWCDAISTEFEDSNFGTPGAENDCTPVITGQCNDNGTMRAVVSPTVGDLVITEVMPNPDAVADDVGEWIEIHALSSFDLNGVGLARASSSSPNVISSADCLHLEAGSYAVFVRNRDMAVNGGIPTDAILGTFNFTLTNGSSSTPGDVRVVLGSTVLDEVTWRRSTAGASRSLDPDFYDPAANDEESNFCDGTTPYGAGDRGTPGAANPHCAAGPVAGQCNDNDTPRPIMKPAMGQLVITEFLANPAGTAAGVDAREEWFEIQNVGTTAFDLNGLGLKGNAATVNTIQSADCKTVPPGGFALFAHSTDPATTGIEASRTVDATFTFALAQGSSGTPGNIYVLDGDTELDRVSWTSSTDGVSDQLHPSQTSTTGNDNAANFCKAQAGQTYGPTANLGTPKAANVCP